MESGVGEYYVDVLALGGVGLKAGGRLAAVGARDQRATMEVARFVYTVGAFCSGPVLQRPRCGHDITTPAASVRCTD